MAKTYLVRQALRAHGNKRYGPFQVSDKIIFRRGHDPGVMLLLVKVESETAEDARAPAAEEVERFLLAAAADGAPYLPVGGQAQVAEMLDERNADFGALPGSESKPPHFFPYGRTIWLDVENPQAPIEYFSRRRCWGERVTAAANAYHRAQCSQPQDMRFLLAFAALATLVAHRPTSVLRKQLGTKTDRRLLIEAVCALLTDRGIDADGRQRLLARVEDTHSESPAGAVVEYLKSRGLTVDASEVAWAQQQRGGFVHSGLMARDQDSIKRRERFIDIVGAALRTEMRSAAPPPASG